MTDQTTKIMEWIDQMDPGDGGMIPYDDFSFLRSLVTGLVAELEEAKAKSAQLEQARAKLDAREHAAQRRALDEPGSEHENDPDYLAWRYC